MLAPVTRKELCSGGAVVATCACACVCVYVCMCAVELVNMGPSPGKYDSASLHPPCPRLLYTPLLRTFIMQASFTTQSYHSQSLNELKNHLAWEITHRFNPEMKYVKRKPFINL